jgi:hypothetical protein
MGYFENFYPTYGETPKSASCCETGIFCPVYARGGLGGDYLIGGTQNSGFRVIDLSDLDMHIMLDLTGWQAGIVTDGIDTIVFQGVEEIILPFWLHVAMLPSLQGCSDHGVRVRAAAGESVGGEHIAAE